MGAATNQLNSAPRRDVPLGNFPHGNVPHGNVPRLRHGFSSVLAMMYLMLFAALALGFYAQTTLSSQISDAERKSFEAQVTAEAGMEFIRFQLSAVNVAEGPTAFTQLHTQLKAQLEGTPNLGARTVAYAPANGASPASITIPSTGYIAAGPSGGGFRAVISDASPNLDVKVYAAVRDGVSRRAIGVQFKRVSKPYALIGIQGMTVSGNAVTDSYDSSTGDPTKPGRYDLLAAKNGGSIGSNGNISIKENARVMGDVTYGRTSLLTVDPTAHVSGTAAPLTTNMSFPSVTLPPAGTYTALGDVNNTTGTQNLPGGTYVIDNLILGGTARIVWQGPVKLYIRYSYNVSNNCSITTFENKPANRQLYFLPTCATASWTGTNVCVGDLYAPDTAFTVAGSVEKMGRIIAKTITNSSSGGMHYDEALPPAYGVASFAPIADSYVEIKP